MRIRGKPAPFPVYGYAQYRDTTRIKDKNGETVFDLVSPEDTEIRTLLRKSQAQASISKDDVADGEVVRYASHTVCLCGFIQMTTTMRESIPARDRTRSNLSRTAALHDHKLKNVISQ